MKNLERQELQQIHQNVIQHHSDACHYAKDWSQLGATIGDKDSGQPFITANVSIYRGLISLDLYNFTEKDLDKLFIFLHQTFGYRNRD